MRSEKKSNVLEKGVLEGEKIIISHGNFIFCETDVKKEFIFFRLDGCVLDNVFMLAADFYHEYVLLKTAKGEKIDFDSTDICFTESKDSKSLMLAILDMDLEPEAEQFRAVEMCNPSFSKRVLSLFGRKPR